jgi:hypothetical protein
MLLQPADTFGDDATAVFPRREDMIRTGHDEMAYERIIFRTIGGESLAEFRDVSIALDLESRHVERDISFGHVDLGAIRPEAFAGAKGIS